MYQNRIILTSAILLSAFTFQTNANANSTGGAYNEHRGPYIAGNLGTIFYAGHDSNGHATSDFSGVSANGTLGYQLNSNIGLEAGLTSMADIVTDSYIYDAAIKGIIPLDNRFSLFGKIGAAGVHVNVCDLFDSSDCHSVLNRSGLFVGAGASVALNHYVDLALEYNGVIVEVNKKSLLMGGLGLGGVFHFG